MYMYVAGVVYVKIDRRVWGQGSLELAEYIHLYVHSEVLFYGRTGKF